jgi:hypothetical protein
MKKTILLTAFLLSICTSNAQILDKGNFLIGSIVGFSTANSTVTTNGTSSEGLSAQ